MGIITPKSYKKLNRLTGLWEWVHPPDEEYIKPEKLKTLNVKTPRKKRR